MIHLKRFNESLQSSEVQELQEFCNDSLVYLLDEGFEVCCDDSSVGLYLPRRQVSFSSHCPFDWNDVKDHYIPFLQLLSRRYELNGYGDSRVLYVVCFQGHRNKYVTLEQAINDNLPTEAYHSLWAIEIRIKSKL